MPTEQPILGLRTGERISTVRDRVALGELIRSVKERRPVTLDGINRNLEAAIGARIPIEFLIESGMSDLRWLQVWHRNAMTALFLGFDQTSPEAEDYSQAESVVALHAKAHDTNPTSTENELIVRPQSLELATVSEDTSGTRRIIHGRYSPTYLELYLRHVSFEDGEEMQQPDRNRFTEEDLKVSTISRDHVFADTTSSRGATVYPLVTKRMFDQVGHNLLADAGTRQSGIRKLHQATTGHEFVTRVGDGPVKAWDIMLPKALEVAA